MKATIKADRLGIEALRDACQELGCTLAEKTSGRTYGGTANPDYVVKVPKATYDVLVTKNHDGTLSCSTDFYQGSVAKVLGENLNRLVQGYQTHRVIREARQRGHTVTKTKLANGTVKLTLGNIHA